jgi:DNA-binding protein YbaB
MPPAKGETDVGASFGDLDGMGQWVEDWQRGAAQLATRAQALADEVAQVAVSVSSKDGAVRITVAASGNVTDLQLTEAIRKYGAAELATEILTVMRKGQAELAGKVAEISSRTLGSDSPEGRVIVESYERRFPQPPSPDDEAGSADDWQRRRAR